MKNQAILAAILAMMVSILSGSAAYAGETAVVTSTDKVKAANATTSQVVFTDSAGYRWRAGQYIDADELLITVKGTYVDASGVEWLYGQQDGEPGYSNCYAIAGVNVPSGVAEVTIPSEISGRKVFKVSDYAFSKHSDKGNIPYSPWPTWVKSVCISENVAFVGEESFSDNGNIESVSFPKSLKTIGFGAFAHCKSLRKADLAGTKIASLGTNAFVSCSSLEKVALPQKYRGESFSATYPFGVFADCKNLQNVNLGGWKSLGKEWFKNCKSLNGISLKKVRHMGNGVFKGCKSLKKVPLSSSMSKIPVDSFKGCKKLKFVKGAKLVKQVGARAFKGCKRLSSLKLLNKGLWKIGIRAFDGCKSLKSLRFKSSCLSSKRVCGSLKGSSVKRITVPVRHLAKYQRAFSKSNCGKAVAVKAA